MATKDWIVTTAGDRELDEVASDLRKRGFHIDQVLREVGCISGKGSDEVAARARKIAGVIDVSATVPVHVGPPDGEDV